MVELLFVWMFFAILFAVFSAAIAVSRGRSGVGWFLVASTEGACPANGFRVVRVLEPPPVSWNPGPQEALDMVCTSSERPGHLVRVRVKGCPGCVSLIGSMPAPWFAPTNMIPFRLNW